MVDTVNAESARPAENNRHPIGRWKARFDAVVGILVLLALVVHPTQISIHQWVRLIFGERLAQHVPEQNVTVSDALFVGAFVLWVIRAIWHRTIFRRLYRYPVALVALFLVGCVSAVSAVSAAQGQADTLRTCAKELIQLGILFVCGYFVLADYLRDERWRRRLVFAFMAAAVAGIACGIVEYAQLRPGDTAAAISGYTISPVEVDGSFGVREGQEPADKAMIPTASNRNVLGAWAALIVPLFWAAALWGCCWPQRIFCALVALAGLPLALTGGLWAAMVLGVLVISFVRHRWLFPAVALILMLVFSQMPDWHRPVLQDSLMLRKAYDRFYTLRAYDDNATRWVQEGGSRHRLRFDDAVGKLQQKWAEWQPGIQVVAQHPFLGVGPGRYQDVIGIYYDHVPDDRVPMDPDDVVAGYEAIDPDRVYSMSKPVQNLMEFGANSFYLVWAVTTGFLGLLALLWVLMTGLRDAACALSRTQGLDRGLALGALGALVALALGMFFAEFIVRGVGVAIVFVLAMASALCESPAEGTEEVAPAEFES